MQETSPTPRAGSEPTAGRRAPDLLITFLRGYGMMAVILLHWFLDFWTAPPDPVANLTVRGSIPWFGWVVGLWVIPGFFFATGATAWRSLGRTPTRPWLWARLKRVLVPYYVLAVVLASAELLAGFAGLGRCRTFGIGNFLSWLIPFPHYDCLMLPSMPLWYVTAFVIVTLLMPLLYRIMKNRWALGLFAAAAVGILVWVGLVLAPLLKEAIAWITIGANVTVSPLQIVAFFAAHAVAWPAFTMLGFAYGNGTLQRFGRTLIPVGMVLMAVGIVPLVTGMFPADIVLHLQPPSITLLIAASGALLVFVGIRDWIGTAMTRLHVVRPLDAVAVRSYTVYLWHMPVYATVWWAAAELGLLDGAWVLAHPVGRNLLIGAMAMPLLFVTVWYFQRFEQPGAVGRLFRRKRSRLGSEAAT